MGIKPVLLRWLSLFVVWIALAGTGGADLAAGALAAALAAWVSLMLVPATQHALSPFAACAFAGRLAWQSLRAGIEVARLALDPRAKLRPGLIEYPIELPPGGRRDAFRALMSLQPGSLPVEIRGESLLLVHCLDTAMPVAEALAHEEARFARLLGGSGNG
ncbi:MAG TPA: Na+/H+ antiporter subunit E [Xanthobacteraceae bacterium]|nr:Na+/H+ antiporter subunit E [Xanthobacteraceae bacterium]